MGVNKNEKRLAYFTSSILIVLLITVGFISIPDKYSHAEKQVDFYDALTSAGQSIRSNSDFISESLYLLKNPDTKSTNAMATVNDIELSYSEYKFRKDFKVAIESKRSDAFAVYNTLVEEKLLIDYAVKHDLIPSDIEVNNFIEQEKVFYIEDAITKKAIDTLCVAANISINEYWGTYEYYNAYRAVVFKKIFDNVIEQGIKENKIRALSIVNNNYIYSEIFEEQINYYNQFIKNLKAEASVKIEEIYSGNFLNYDPSNLYL